MRSLKSCIGYMTILVGFANYVSSIVYIYWYMKYSKSLDRYNLDDEACEIESSWIVLTYCSLFQIPLGSLCCLIYTLGCMIKVGWALTFLCPGCVTKLKKKRRGIPLSFEHY